ncbi:MAG: NAD+ synthase [Candidatus Aminicenantes bacterium]|nr:NAD+ synthase [Candidatus Aminicenantes bacterium]MBL7083374.1 NAD+ synthase [Candidatus Aminicenantes bacterium]
MKINEPFVEKILTTFINEELSKFQYKKGILGLSGGLDSSVCASLAAKALKPGNVFALIMPYGKIFSDDVKEAQKLAQALGIKFKIIDITPMVDIYFSNHPTEDRILKGNKMARERMSILYDFSAREKGLILGTSNKTELLLGYGTIHGDMACAINPLGDLYKTQLKQLAKHLGIPEKIRKKTPSAGLWAGQTDEKEIGLDYNKIDKILFHLVDKRMPKKEIIASGFKKTDVDKIISLIKNSEFKRKLPIIPKISARTIGHDFLLPYDWGK